MRPRRYRAGTAGRAWRVPPTDSPRSRSTMSARSVLHPRLCRRCASAPEAGTSFVASRRGRGHRGRDVLDPRRALLSVGPAHDDRVDRAGVRVQELPRRGDGDAGRGRAQRHVPDDVGPAAAERLAQRGGERVVEDDDVAGLDPVAGERLAVARALGVLGMLAPAEPARLTAEPGRRGQRAREAQRLVELRGEGAERLVGRDLELLRDDAPVGRQAAAQRVRRAAPGGQRGRAPHGAPAEAVGRPRAGEVGRCARAARSTAVPDDRSPRSASLSLSLAPSAQGVGRHARRSTVAVDGPPESSTGSAIRNRPAATKPNRHATPRARVTAASNPIISTTPATEAHGDQRRQRAAAHRGAGSRHGAAAPAQAGRRAAGSARRRPR